MEDTLRESLPLRKQQDARVLILVLMEDTLRDLSKREKNSAWSLNPCFNGRYSQSRCRVQGLVGSQSVLILVLMEDTLRDG